MELVGKSRLGLYVALLAEGCYPFVSGGVSTWCEQLIRGLDENRFEVIAVTGADNDEPRFPQPDNVVRLRTVPLWGFEAPARPVSRAQRKELLRGIGPFFESLVCPDAPQEQFDEGLRFLFYYARAVDLTAGLKRPELAELLSETWRSHRGHVLTVYETLRALDLLEHSLRPLAEPPVKADVCHAVSNGLPSLLALTSKWAYGTPFVMSEHGVYLRERYLFFQTVDCPWPVKSIVLAFFRRLTRTAYRYADVIAPVNLYNQRWEVEYGADPKRIITAFNGVDAGKYPVATTEPDVPTVVWVGRIDPLKDLVTLIEGFRLVRERIPAARLRLFGPTPPGNAGYEATIRERVNDLALNDCVSFEGPVSPVSDAYHAAHVVALTSISEGLPYTVIEAMMCGRATVSTEVGGVPELVGDAGLLVPPHDPTALADALCATLQDAGLRAQLATRARQRALGNFRVEQMLETFRGIYSLATSAGAAEISDHRVAEQVIA